MKSEGGVEAVNRALSILTSFQKGDDSLTLAELAKRTEFYKSTLLRLLASLEHSGFVRRLPDKSFQLGSAVMRLACVYQTMFRLEDMVRPVLKELVIETGETSTFFRCEGRTRVCLYRENSNHGLRDHVHEGQVLPLEKGAAGRVLLKFSKIRFKDMTPQMERQLPILSRSELDLGTFGLSVPVFGADGQMTGALAISGPLIRLTTERLKQSSLLLLRAGRGLTSELGAG